MTNPTETPSPSATDRELVLTRLIAAPREKLFKAWTTPELLVQWFTPKPWETVRAEVALRAGGSSLIVMRGPDGSEFPNRGIYLEVVRMNASCSPMPTPKHGSLRRNHS